MQRLAVRVWETAEDPRQRARAVLVRTAAELVGAPVAEIRLTREPSGRPRLAGAGAHLHVSVSHGRGVVAVALCPVAPVGVDIERLRPVPALALARRWLSGPDAAWVAGQPPALRTAAFFWLWTQKEAVGKARGTGLRGGGMRQPLALPGAGWPPADCCPLALHPVPGEARMVAGAGRLPAELVLGVACADRLD